ncbi:MAG TPA: hypothetical protein VMW10_03215 [Alphaproteobacteria bacterium]|nr:hypothetical protein [Alphaproteobacteria bacterium]
MFKLIEPKNQELQKPVIDLFLSVINKNPGLAKAFPDFKNATFILNETAVNGVSGGALLLKQTLSSLQKDIRKILSSPTSRDREVWTCVVALYVDNYNLVDDFESYGKIFMKNLLNSLSSKE